MNIVSVKFSHAGLEHSVALCPGIFPEELSKVLSTIFGFNDKSSVIGFQGQDGVIIPITLACRSIETLASGPYNVIANETEIHCFAFPPITVPPQPKVGVPLPPIPPKYDSSSTTESNLNVNLSTSGRPPERRETRKISSTSAPEKSEINNQEPSVTKKIPDQAIHELLRFIASLRAQRMLTKIETQAMEELVFDSNPLILAAFSVAHSANDSEYLAEIIIDISQSMKTKAGRSALLAQEEMLMVCEKLFLSGKVTQNQLLYLRHMVLIREDVVASIYDAYLNHGSIALMARQLFDVANMKNSSKKESEDGQDEEEDDDEEEEEQEQQPEIRSNQGKKETSGVSKNIDNSEAEDEEEDEEEEEEVSNDIDSTAAVVASPARLHRPQAPSPMCSTLKGIIATMRKEGQITSAETAILLELVNEENEYVGASFELFEHDSNEEELRDTLMRCAKLEFKKRVAASRGAKLRYQQYIDANSDKTKKNETATTSSSTTTHAAATTTNTTNSMTVTPTQSEIEDSLELYEDDGEDDDEDQDDDVDTELNSEKNENASTGSGPVTSQLGQHLKELLNNLNVEDTWSSGIVPQQFIFTVFAAAYKNLMSIPQARALCDLYQSQYDLVRAAWEVYSVQGDVRDFSDTLLRIVRDLNLDDINKDLSKSQHLLQQSAQQNNNKLALEKAEKIKAKQAVKEAKKDLLQHSLDMMVKQGLTEQKNATMLLERAERGDVLVDAAIEAYAGDRDVAEFLDTLQILANNSQEELDAIMRSAANELPAPTPAPTVSTSRSGSAANSPSKQSVTTSTTMGTSMYGSSTSPLRPVPAPGPTSTSTSPGGVPKQSPVRAVETIRSPVTTTTTTSANDNNLSQETKDAQVQLRLFISELYDEGSVSLDMKTTLYRLVAANDDRIMASFDVYRDFRDREDFIDSLIRIAKRELGHNSPSKNITSTTTSMGGLATTSTITISTDNTEDEDDGEDEQDDDDDDDDDNDDDEDNYNDDDENEEEEEDDDDDEEEILFPVKKSPTNKSSGLLNSDDQIRIIEILKRADALSESHAKHITSMIKNNDDRIATVFMQYETTKDVAEMILGLRVLMDKTDGGGGSSSNSKDNDINDDDSEDEEEEEEQEEEDAGEDEEDGELDEEAHRYMDTRFLDIVKNMKLTHLETAALRLAIARNDNSIRGALEVFKQDLNEEELIDTLRRIAKRTIEDTMRQAEEDDDNEDDEEEEEQEKEDDGNNGDISLNSTNSGNDGDKLLYSQSARDHVFPILINELSKENIISKLESKQLLKLFGEGNKVVHAALDIYDLDSNMAELVDTLQRVAKDVVVV